MNTFRVNFAAPYVFQYSAVFDDSETNRRRVIPIFAHFLNRQKRRSIENVIRRREVDTKFVHSISKFRIIRNNTIHGRIGQQKTATDILKLNEHISYLINFTAPCMK